MDAGSLQIDHRCMHVLITALSETNNRTSLKKIDRWILNKLNTVTLKE